MVQHADAIDVVEAAEIERAQLEQRSPHEAHPHSRRATHGSRRGVRSGGGVGAAGVGGATAAVLPRRGQQAARSEPRPAEVEVHGILPMYAVRAWRVHGVCMACAWRTYGGRMACARCAHGVRMVCAWCAYGAYTCLASATEEAERSRWTTSDRLKPHAGWRACSAAISEASCTWPSARVQRWGWDRV